MDDVVVGERGERSGWSRHRLRRVVPLVAVAALATGCYRVEIEPIAPLAPPEPGQPVEVCAEIESQEASVPGLGRFAGDLVFTRDTAAAPAPVGRSVRTASGDGRACSWHVYHCAGTFEVQVQYAADLLAEPDQPGVLSGRSTVTVVAPPDPQPFLIGYPTSADGDWWFSYRNRWFSAADGLHRQIDPTAQLLPYRWEITDSSGAVVFATSTIGPDLVHRLAPGTYRVEVTAAFEGDGIDEPITATDVRWITAGT